MLWKLIQNIGVIGGLLSLFFLCKERILPYILQKYYHPKLQSSIHMHFFPSADNPHETFCPAIRFEPSWVKKKTHNWLFPLKGKYILTIGKIFIHLPRRSYTEEGFETEWRISPRKEGYLTFCKDFRWALEVEPGNIKGLGSLGIKMQPGEYEIIADIELLFKIKKTIIIKLPFDIGKRVPLKVDIRSREDE